jgi:hypothetical protein
MSSISDACAIRNGAADNTINLRNVRELETTRAKLELLEDRYEASKREEGGNEYVRELSRRSVKRLINQMKEEIARFEAHASTYHH